MTSSSTPPRPAATRSRPPRTGRVGRLLLLTSWTLAVATLVLTVGTFVWQAPVIGLVGSLGGHLPGWMIVIAVAGVAAGVAAWVLRRQKRAVAAALVCLLGVLGGATIIADQSQALERVGVQARPGDFFMPYLRSTEGPDEVIEYGPVDGRTARMGIYRPTDTPANAPVVVLVHGGSFTGGNLEDETPLARHLTDRGYLVFAPTYTLATASTPTWDIAPAQIVCAIATVNTIAGDHGGDNGRFYVGGTSAGGNLAALAANHVAEDDALGTDCGPLPQIDAVVLTIAATDVGFAEGTPYAIIGPMARDIAQTYTGGTPEEVPDRYAAVNATAALTANSPPTLLVFGENDWLVSSQASLSYAQRARALGVPVHAVGVPWTGHFILLNGAGGRAIGELTDRWFDQHQQ